MDKIQKDFKYIKDTDLAAFSKKMTQSYDKSTYTQRKIQKSKTQRDNTQKNPPQKTSITQRLRTDLGRSVGVTIVSPMVWLNRFTSAQLSH